MKMHQGIRHFPPMRQEKNAVSGRLSGVRQVPAWACATLADTPGEGKVRQNWGLRARDVGGRWRTLAEVAD